MSFSTWDGKAPKCYVRALELKFHYTPDEYSALEHMFSHGKMSFFHYLKWNFL